MSVKSFTFKYLRNNQKNYQLFFRIFPRFSPPTHLGVLPEHHLDELVEVDGAVAVLVHVADHVGQLVLGRVEAVVAHHSPELAHGDLAVVVGVEEREGLLEKGKQGFKMTLQLSQLTEKHGTWSLG